jgi:hypothetical protein
MAIITILISIMYGFYILVSLLRRRWNDFLYGICLGLLIISNIPTISFVISLLGLIILHRYIEVREKNTNES